MSSENILLNSPALHSLKRAQLIGLCKRHGLRAAGKNVELIDRLKEHGRSGALMSLSDDENDDQSPIGGLLPNHDYDESYHDTNMLAPRPSEAWSMVDEPSDVEVNTLLKGSSRIKEFGDKGESAPKCVFISQSINRM